MAISYNPLWKKLIDKNIKKSSMASDIGLNASTLASMGKNQFVSLKTINKICDYLNCNIHEVVEYVDGKEEENDKK